MLVFKNFACANQIFKDLIEFLKSTGYKICSKNHMKKLSQFFYKIKKQQILNIKTSTIKKANYL